MVVRKANTTEIEKKNGGRYKVWCCVFGIRVLTDVVNSLKLESRLARHSDERVHYIPTLFILFECL